MKLKRMLVLIFFVSMGFSPLYAKIDMTEKLPIEKSLIEGELKNGFKYIIKKNSKPRNRAVFRLVVKVGSLEEDDDQKGVAHFVEHMAFNGSTHFKENELIKYIESMGLRFGSHLNASTGYERTLYALTIPLEKDNLEKSFLVFKDWAGGLSFNEKEFEKERGVILEEERQRDTVGLRLYNQYKSMVLGTSKYMYRIPIGDIETISNVKLQRVKDFYNDWYRPEFMHFVAVGDFDEKEIEAQIKKHFSTLMNKSKRKRASRKIEDNNQTRVRFLSDKELTSNSFSVEYIDVIQRRQTKHDMRTGLIESMMFRLFNMKAKEQLLKNNPKATSIGFSSSETNSQKGKYSFSVNYRDENELLALKELYALVWSFEQYGFSQDNLDIIKKEKISDNQKWYENLDDRYSSSLASRLVSYAEHHDDSVYVDDKENYRISKELILDIKLEEINAYFKKILTIKDRVILFKNTSEKKISKKVILETIEEAKSETQDFTKIKKLGKELLSKTLEVKKIVSKTFHKKGEFYEFVLENGVKVAFKKTDFSKDRVSLQAFSLGGDSLYGVDKLDDAQKASGFIAQSGVGDFSIIDVGKILADKHVAVSTSISNLTENIYASANANDIDEMFQLLYLKLTQPKVDEVVAKNRKEELKYVVEQSIRNPRKQFRKEFTSSFYKNNPRITFNTVESIQKLNNKKMLEIYQDRFSDINNFTFVIIGDIELDKLELAMAKYLGNLPIKNRKESFIAREKEYLKGKQTFTRAYNNKNITQVTITYNTQINYSKKKAFMLEIIESTLSTRLRELIREEKSAVYGIGVKLFMYRLGKDRSAASMYFSCDPKRADELISEILTAIEKLKKDGITKKEFNTYRKKYRVNHETSLRENSYWLGKLITTYKHNTTLEDELFNLEEVLESISLEDITKMVDSLFKEDRVIAKLKPKQ